MIRSQLTTLLPALALVVMTSLPAAAAPPDDTPPADSAPPPADSAPGTGTPKGHHHNAAWQTCKKQADDQKIAAGDARHEFMKNCMKSAKETAPPQSS